ncbi:3-phosphoshikimate 1-carboxyvinyltransferase [Brevibacterium pityocampae]|uniref:3-phosphoshikimate 1-carboxyvinyltransferase n=1 Tax=Brevibacterium pityocampae TaxID=506594 RepID=A0ABP8JIZ4_9MICO
MTHSPERTWLAPCSDAPVRATVAVPGSKSLTNRFLVLAALATEPSRIAAPLISRDTELMIAALTALGARIVPDADGALRIKPIPGPEAVAGTDPVTVDCGLAGTVMRFVPPLAAATGRRVRFDGDPQAYVRPMSTMLDALRRLGAEVTTDSGTDAMPFTVEAAGGVRGGHLDLDASATSQFVSGLLLAAGAFDLGLELTHTGERLPSRPHIDMTLETLADAGVHVSEPEPHRWVVEPGRPHGLQVAVEPDLSNAATFLGAALVTRGTVTIPHWPAHTTQAGDAMRGIAEEFGATSTLSRTGLEVTGPARLRGVDLDLGDVGELTPVVAAIAACAEFTSTLRNIGHLRGHETDRLSALATELTKTGARVTEGPDSLIINSPATRGARWATYHDHRMVMAAAVLGLRVEGIEIEDVATVGKTMPEFTALWTAMLG